MTSFVVGINAGDTTGWRKVISHLRGWNARGMGVFLLSSFPDVEWHNLVAIAMPHRRVEIVRILPREDHVNTRHSGPGRRLYTCIFNVPAFAWSKFALRFRFPAKDTYHVYLESDLIEMKTYRHFYVSCIFWWLCWWILEGRSVHASFAIMQYVKLRGLRYIKYKKMSREKSRLRSVSSVQSRL
jgi:hypothetical protein